MIVAVRRHTINTGEHPLLCRRAPTTVAMLNHHATTENLLPSSFVLHSLDASIPTEKSNKNRQKNGIRVSKNTRAFFLEAVICLRRQPKNAVFQNQFREAT